MAADPVPERGPLHFGMKRDTVIRTLAEEPVLRATDPVLAETFQGAGVNVEYDQSGRLLSVEGFDRSITYLGIRFLGRSVDEVLRDLRDSGLVVNEEAPAGPDVPNLGLRLVVEPERNGTATCVTGVMVVREGYDST